MNSFMVVTDNHIYIYIYIYIYTGVVKSQRMIRAGYVAGVGKR